MTLVRIIRLQCVVGLLLIVGGCAYQPRPEAFDPPGFWLGLVHGAIILFSFIGSLFTDVRIYAFPNSGVMYDLGFLMGAVAAIGGSGAGARGAA